MRGIDAMRPLELGRYALETRAGRGGHLMDERAIRALMGEVERLTAELEQRIDPARLRAIADAVPGEKAAYLIAYQRGDWGIYALRPERSIARASTAADAIATAECALGGPA